MRRPNGQHELIAVHADRRESELETVPKETLALWQSTGKAGPEGGPGRSRRETLQHVVVCACWPCWWQRLWSRFLQGSI